MLLNGLMEGEKEGEKESHGSGGEFGIATGRSYHVELGAAVVVDTMYIQ